MTILEAIRNSLRLLRRRDRRLLVVAVGLQMAVSFLDLIGVTLVGLMGALALSTVQGQPPPGFVTKVISSLSLSGLSGGTGVVVLAAAAAAFLLAKNVLSPVLMIRVFRFLARRQAIVSGVLAKALLSRPLTFVQKRSSQETASALLTGPGAAIVLVLGQGLLAAAELTLLALLSVLLLLVDPAVALGAIGFFALFAFVMQKVLGYRVAQAGAANVVAEIASLRAVQEALGAYREISVADRQPLYVDRIETLRGDSARATTTHLAFSMLPKYAAEAALVLGAFALAGVLFATKPMAVAAGTFALFLATATRVMPSLLRLAAAGLAIRNSAEAAAPTYVLAQELRYPRSEPRPAEVTETIRRALELQHDSFEPSIEIEKLDFTYPGADAPALQGIDLVVRHGQSIALVGRSGAGKSTLADIILGMLEPDTGTVTVGGLRPTDAVHRWPGGIAYVPQEVMLVNNTVRANVALGLPAAAVDDDLVWNALERAHLSDHVRGEPHGLDTQVGERGLRISGGQRQRLGIARALFTRPRLLVLDEATSALDAETEQAITLTLDALQEDVTTIVVAHRLSTVRNADLVVYLESGRIVARGTFDEVCSNVPALQRQADLMGLGPARAQ